MNRRWNCLTWRARITTWTIAPSDLVRGNNPLLRYVFSHDVVTALRWSVAVTPVALFIFRCVRSEFTGLPHSHRGFKAVLVGGLPAAAAFAMARLLGCANVPVSTSDDEVRLR